MQCWIGLLFVSFSQYSCLFCHFAIVFWHVHNKKVSINECTGVFASLSSGQAAIGVCLFW